MSTEERRKLAAIIASMSFEDCRYLGISPYVALKCRQGEVPNFHTKTIKRFSPWLNAGTTEEKNLAREILANF